MARLFIVPWPWAGRSAAPASARSTVSATRWLVSTLPATTADGGRAFTRDPSGATITLALFLGLRRDEAARFIFLLAIPAILGAAAHEAPKVLKAGMSGETGLLFLIGVMTSAVVGYLAVKYFIRYLASHSLDVFAWYRLALAASVLLWL